MKFKFTHPEPTDKDLVGPKYWKSLDEVAGTPAFNEWVEREFPDGASESTSVDRRHFLKIMAASFSLAGLGLAGCRQPEMKILPYSKQPERNIPGLPVYYTTSQPTPVGNIPLLVETHGSRPTKVEGNPSYKPYGGGTDIFAQASILDLYDADRAEKSSRKHGEVLSKGEVLDAFKKVYETFKVKEGEGLAFLTEKTTSPTRQRMVLQLKEKLPKAVWAEYEPVDVDNQDRAYKEQFGGSIRPIFHFEKAKRILALDSDFLHSGPSHLAYSRGFSELRRVKDSSDTKKMNRLYAAESYYTLTGGMADHRLRIATSHIPALASLFAAEILEITGGDASLANLLKGKANGLDVDKKWITECARDLVEHRGSSVVIAGAHLPKEVHLLVYIMNRELGAPDNTVSYCELPVQEANTIQDLAAAIAKNSVETLIVLGGNPIYNAPADLNWKKLQAKVPQVIVHSYYANETTKVGDIHVAANHYLESWSDGRTHDGTYVPVQPMIMPLFEGHSDLEVLAHLMGLESPDPYAMVRETFSQLIKRGSFDSWLAVGIAGGSDYPKTLKEVEPKKLFNQLAKVDFNFAKLSIQSLELRFLPSNQVGDGRYNNNGWLQECPDPMSKLAWDNAISISPRLARELEKSNNISLMPAKGLLNKTGQLKANANNFVRGKENAFIAEITLNGKTIQGPLHVQPGLADYTVALSLGYGRSEVGRVGQGTGFDVYPLLASNDMSSAVGGALKISNNRALLANTQEHWSMEGRAILREACADVYAKNPNFVQEMGMESHSPAIYGSAKDLPLDQKVNDIPRGGGVYETPVFKGVQQWGMVIDLNTCTGCNACVVACQSENNIPIVGKDQVLRGREMHWLRLDRYYSSGADEGGELPEDPQVSFMGIACQHCELAPCEMVCPVNATVHDDEGLNVMAYNRCVGTRYCANNCPYKVRRFNFFDWNKRAIGHFYEGPLGPVDVTELGKMQKNPDVTVRMRGVMEKCTYCVQRIEEAKISQRVKVKGSPDVDIIDGSMNSACQQVCSSDSITFGDIADPDSAVSQLKQSDRNYSLLGYLNVRPRTTYLAKLRNPNPLMSDCHLHPLSYVEYEKRNGHGVKGSHGESYNAATH